MPLLFATSDPWIDVGREGAEVRGVYEREVYQDESLCGRVRPVDLGVNMLFVNAAVLGAPMRRPSGGRGAGAAVRDARPNGRGAVPRRRLLKQAACWWWNGSKNNPLEFQQGAIVARVLLVPAPEAEAGEGLKRSWAWLWPGPRLVDQHGHLFWPPACT